MAIKQVDGKESSKQKYLTEKQQKSINNLDEIKILTIYFERSITHE